MVGRSLKALFLATAMLSVAAAGSMAQTEKQEQQPAAAGAGKMCKGMQCMMGGGMMKGPEHMAAMQAARIAYLKTALGITEAQAGVWNEYVAALKANPSKMQGMMKGMMGANKGTAIEQMNARVERTKAKLRNQEAMKPATEALYNALNAEQKKKADAILLRQRGMM